MHHATNHHCALPERRALCNNAGHLLRPPPHQLTPEECANHFAKKRASYIDTNIDRDNNYNSINDSSSSSRAHGNGVVDAQGEGGNIDSDPWAEPEYRNTHNNDKLCPTRFRWYAFPYPTVYHGHPKHSFAVVRTKQAGAGAVQPDRGQMQLQMQSELRHDVEKALRIPRRPSRSHAHAKPFSKYLWSVNAGAHGKAVGLRMALATECSASAACHPGLIWKPKWVHYGRSRHFNDTDLVRINVESTFCTQ